LPDYEEVAIGDAKVAVVTVARGMAKPHVLRHNDREDVYVRYGDTCRLATREQIARLFDSSGLLSAEELPVYGSHVGELDARRRVEYFQRILGEDSMENQEELLVNRSFLVGDDDPQSCSIFAHALFAKAPGRRLPQAVARITVYLGDDKDYDTAFDKVVDAAYLEYRGELPGDVIEPALHELMMQLVQPYISEDKVPSGTRIREWDYPREAVRELIINALTHRDWTKQNYVRVVVYNNRMEIISPGALPNGMTVAKIKSGAQLLRNPRQVRIFREYGYLEDQGIGIRRKVLPLMREHNGSEPAFEATEDAFKVTLQKRRAV